MNRCLGRDGCDGRDIDAKVDRVLWSSCWGRRQIVQIGMTRQSSSKLRKLCKL
jgi:hypothetical protein